MEVLNSEIASTGFTTIFNRHSWESVAHDIYSKTDRDVEFALSSPRKSLEDFKALISPAAAPYLEQMAQMSRTITQKRFGKTIQLYTPLYLSNECNNICTYCGFSFDNKIKRRTLTDTEILKEAQAIKELGFDHVLLVTGEANQSVHVEYFKNALKILRPLFSNISIEVQPLDENEYATLVPFGVHSVLVYQETYNRNKYRDYHTKGKKSNFDYRLQTPDRIGATGMHKIGLGVLLGLEDWRIDSFFTALHHNYLEKKFWQTKYSISFPRIRPAEGVDIHGDGINDRELVQLICAWRICNEEVELSVSTRESEIFRNNIIHLGATTMSAGSKTNPGGYAVEPESLEQFHISDERTPAEFAKVIAGRGYEPVWKDWEKSFEVHE